MQAKDISTALILWLAKQDGGLPATFAHLLAPSNYRIHLPCNAKLVETALSPVPYSL